MFYMENKKFKNICYVNKNHLGFIKVVKGTKLFIKKPQIINFLNNFHKILILHSFNFQKTHIQNINIIIMMKYYIKNYLNYKISDVGGQI